MSVIDKVVAEWAFRCKKGYPDMKNPADMKILKEIYSEYGIVMEEEKQEVLKKELKKFFAPEFLNRIDDVIIFNSLEKRHIDQITKLEVDKLLKRVLEKHYNFIYDQDLIDYLSKVGFDETFGARPIKRAIQDKIEDLISEKILMMEIEENKEYFLKVENDEVIVTNKEEKPKTGRRRKNNE